MKNLLKKYNLIYLILFTCFYINTVFAQNKNIQDSSNCNKKGRIAAITGIGFPNGLHTGLKYNIFQSISSELTVGYMDINLTGRITIAGTGINYHFFQKKDGSLIVSFLFNYLNEYETWSNNTDHYFTLAATLGFEEFVNNSASMFLRFGYAKLIQFEHHPENTIQFNIGLNIYFN